MSGGKSRIAIVVLILAIAVPVLADRTLLKPGFNIFSVQQDIEMGRQVSKQAESQLQILNDSTSTAYVNDLGKRLAARAPNHPELYPFQFRIINDKAINAFALPGGFVYVNRGAFEAAANEAQIAGVIGHEIGHVVMRHGTNQASKAYATKMPLAILGGMIGRNSIGAVMAQLGIGFGANSVILHYSREAESQADLIGTQILYDSGYDPKQMSNFFEKLQAEGGSGGSASQFFSDHPNPENRIGNVDKEIEKLGGAPPSAKTDSPEFLQIKSLISNGPAPRGAAPTARGSSGGGRSNGPKPPRASSRFIDGQLGTLRFRYPDNWKQSGQGTAITIAPDSGIVSGSLTYGMIVATYEGHPDPGKDHVDLDLATDQLINDLKQSNPQMQIVRSHDETRIGGRPAFSNQVSNQSPAGGNETDMIVTVAAPDGTIYYFVGVAPQVDFASYQTIFRDILDAVRFQ